MAKLTQKDIKSYADKIGKEEVIITASILVQILNEKHGGKTNGKQFKFNDIQQYYLREKLPVKYGGLKIKFNTTHLGSTLTVFAEAK